MICNLSIRHYNEILAIAIKNRYRAKNNTSFNDTLKH